MNIELLTEFAPSHISLTINIELLTEFSDWRSSKYLSLTLSQTAKSDYAIIFSELRERTSSAMTIARAPFYSEPRVLLFVSSSINVQLPSPLHCRHRDKALRGLAVRRGVASREATLRVFELRSRQSDDQAQPLHR